MSAMPPRSVVQVSLSNELREQLAGFKDAQGGPPDNIIGAACYIMRIAVYEFVSFIGKSRIDCNRSGSIDRYHSEIKQFDLQYYVLYEQRGRHITVWDIVFSSPDSHPPRGGGPSSTRVIVSKSNTDAAGALDVVTVMDDLFDIAASAPPSDGLEFLHTFQGVNTMFVTGSSPAAILARMATAGATMRTPFFTVRGHGADVACECGDAINAGNHLDGGQTNAVQKIDMTSDMQIVLDPFMATGATIYMPFFMTRDSGDLIDFSANPIGQLCKWACEQPQITADASTVTAVPTVTVGQGQQLQVGLLANANKVRALATLTDGLAAQATTADVRTRLGSAIGAMVDETGALGDIQSGLAILKSLAMTETATTKQASKIEEKRMERKRTSANRAHFDVVTPLGC